MCQALLSCRRKSHNRFGSTQVPTATPGIALCIHSSCWCSGRLWQPSTCGPCLHRRRWNSAAQQTTANSSLRASTHLGGWGRAAWPPPRGSDPRCSSPLPQSVHRHSGGVATVQTVFVIENCQRKHFSRADCVKLPLSLSGRVGAGSCRRSRHCTVNFTRAEVHPWWIPKPHLVQLLRGKREAAQQLCRQPLLDALVDRQVLQRHAALDRDLGDALRRSL